MPIPTSEQKLERIVVSHFRKALTDYQLINDGDKILVGLSGGKDSLALLELLAKRMRINKPSFTVDALHVRMENVHYESDTSYLCEFAENLGVKLHIVTTSFDASTDKRKSPCFLCSWNRRKQMFLKAQELGCNKIALGHHQDDIIHTTLLNMTFQGSFSTMPVKLKMRKMPITIIRPLCLEKESDLLKYSQLRNYAKQVKLCPYETDSHRNDIKELFRQLEMMNPEARSSIWNSLENENKLIEE